MRQGEIQAEGARRSSDIWANAIGSAGSTLAAGAQGWTKRREEKKEKEGIAKQDQAFLELFKDPEKQPTIEDTVRIYGMDRGMAIYKGYSSLQSEKPDLDTVLSGFEAASPEMRAVAWPKARGHLVARGVPQETLPGQDQYDDEWYQRFKKARSGEKPQGLIKGSPGDVFLDPTTHEQVAAIPSAPKPDTRSLEARLAAAVPGSPEAQQILKTMGQQAAATRGPAAPKDERLVQIMGPAGTPIWVREGEAVGKPAAQAARAVTGAERQSLAYFNRAKDAAENIAPLEEKMSKAGLGRQAQLQYAPNLLQTAEQQAYRQAQRAFTEARLRKESGAAIPVHEYENDSKTYFAQPGDSELAMEQKRKARNKVLEGLGYAAGKAYEEFYGEPLATPKTGKGNTAKDDPLGFR